MSLAVIFFIFFNSCAEPNKSKSAEQKEFNYSEQITKKKLPEHLRELERLTAFSSDTQAPDTIELVRETTFKSNENVFIDGYISTVAVDDQNRVYIASTMPGSAKIYVFKGDGNYLTEIGRYGRGPGEYEAIASISISNGIIYVLDSKLQKIGFFSLHDYSHIRDEIIKRDQLEPSEKLARRLRGNELFVTEDERILLKLRMISLYEGNDIPEILYYELTNEAAFKSSQLLSLQRFSFYFPKNRGRVDVPFTMPFTRNSLIAISKKGHFFTAWTEDFLIKEYDEEGNYLKAFYYPIDKSGLSVDGLGVSKSKQKVLKQYEIPRTWPALHAMELDDEDRLWVATITNSEKKFRWWVLNSDGELLANFTLSGERSSRPIMGKPILEIKNGFFYKHERDVRKGIDRIVKYEINFVKR